MTLLPYRNPPIVEAVLDIQVEEEGGVEVSTLEHLKSGSGWDFPVSEPMFQATVEFGAVANAKSVARQAGWSFSDESRRVVVQSRLNGFAYCRLSPYEDWKSFRNDAEVVWKKYRQLRALAKIQRVAVRYINRIDLQISRLELQDYFRIYPEVPLMPSQTMADFFLRVVLEEPEILSTAIVHQACTPPAKPDVISIVLDVDLFRVREVPQDETGLWGLLDKMRTVKDRLFEACITEKTRELFR